MHSDRQSGGPQYLDLLLEAVGFHLHYRDIFAKPPLQRRDQRPLIEYFPVPCPREHHDTRLGEATLGALGLPLGLALGPPGVKSRAWRLEPELRFNVSSCLPDVPALHEPAVTTLGDRALRAVEAVLVPKLVARTERSPN